MGAEERTSNGDGTECGEAGGRSKPDAVNNGFAVGMGTCVADGSSGGSSEGFRTYKRRKQAKSFSGSKVCEDGQASVEVASQLAHQIVKEPREENISCEQATTLPGMGFHATVNSSNDCSKRNRRNVVLEHMYQILHEDEGAVQGCIREALVFHQEVGCRMKELVDSDECREKSPSQTVLIRKESQNAGVMSNISPNESDQHTVTNRCQRALCNIIISEKFASLCKLLVESFQGSKVDSFHDLNHINSRLREGAYECSPMLFSSDIQQVWKRLQGIGVELISLAKSLSDVSMSSYWEQMGVSEHGGFEDRKHEFCTLEPDSHTKAEQTEACGVNKVCTCRSCGGNANGRDCLVCDSCEEIYHISCIEPAVEEIPSRSWYCLNCTARAMVHKDCVVCERLNALRTRMNGVRDEITLTNEDTLEGCTNLHLCKLCGGEVKNGKGVWICGHPFCPNKYYHKRCLTSKQSKSYGSCWYCPSCLCRICLTDRDDDKIVLCDGCNNAYHIYCMKPVRTSIPKGKWFCRKCATGIQKIRSAKRAYEKFANKQNMKGEGGRKTNEELEKKSNEEDGEESCKGREGMDMLLSAANTLKY